MSGTQNRGFSYLVHKFQNSGGMILEFAFPLLLLFTVPHSVKHRRKTTFPLDLVCLALPSCVTPSPMRTGVLHWYRFHLLFQAGAVSQAQVPHERGSKTQRSRGERGIEEGHLTWA